jgi:hypothetical protein
MISEKEPKPAKRVTQAKGLELLAAADARVAELRELRRRNRDETIEVRGAVTTSQAAEREAIARAAVAGEKVSVEAERARTAALCQRAEDVATAGEAIDKALREAELACAQVIADHVDDFVSAHEAEAAEILDDLAAIELLQGRVEARLGTYRRGWERTLRAVGGDYDVMQQRREPASGELTLDEQLRPSRVPGRLTRRSA